MTIGLSLVTSPAAYKGNFPLKDTNYEALHMSLTLEKKQNQIHTKEIFGLHCDCKAGETLWLEFPESSPHRIRPLYTHIENAAPISVTAGYRGPGAHVLV